MVLSISEEISMGGVSVAGASSFAHREECEDTTEAQENFGFGQEVAFVNAYGSIEAEAWSWDLDRKGSVLVVVWAND